MAELTPIVLCLSRAGYKTARRVADALNVPLHGREGRVDEADAYFPNALDHVRTLFQAGHPVIGICAAGILVRAVAPVLVDKHSEPPLICIPDDGSTVIPLLGGHHGANRLAKQIAEALKSRAAVTTAGDVALGVALDEPPLGWRLANPEAAKDAMMTLLNGGGAYIRDDEAPKAHWLQGLPEGNDLDIYCTTDAYLPEDKSALLFHPLRVTLGVGCSRGCPPQELEILVKKTLKEADVAPKALRGIFSLDLKADEPAMLELAKNLDLPIRFFNAESLEKETYRVENASEVVFAEVGCHSVSEAAAVRAAGPDGYLGGYKRKSKHATCALAYAPQPIEELRGNERGKLSIIGIGPGQHSWRTPEASMLVAEASELVGYGLYIDLLGPLAFGKKRTDFPLGGEEDRCRYALEQAGKGHNVALICSGDAGIYAMGALVFELLDRGPDALGVSDAARRIEVVSTPGVSALQGAAARAGAPLGHDFCAISLSDLLTPREDIIKRLHAAAEGDFVIAFYNPVSKRRRTLLAEARDILLQHRPADTPVMLASSLGRPEEYVRYVHLKDLQVDDVDMLTVVLVGSSNSKLAQLGEGPRMYTPRGYARKIDGDLS
ncbi:MAG: precorrin-3B C(17)-methyltransferase [Rhodobacteraceae bacterium]|nr:precorrin-3B C(17)-methyltransferase [Paracoccaceae bacterium]